MKKLLKTQPSVVIHTVLAVLSTIVAVIVNLSANVPADANWLVTGLIVLKLVAGELTKRFVFSPATVESLTKLETTVTSTGVTTGPSVP